MSTVFSSDISTNGHTYTQQYLSDWWVQQTFSTPTAVNPFISNNPLDPTLGRDDSTNLRGRRGSVELNASFQANSPEGITFLGGLVVPTERKVILVRTIIGQPGTTYFAPFANQMADNTTTDTSPASGFPGGYALTPQHLIDLQNAEPELHPRSISPDNSLPTLLDLVQSVADSMGEQGKQFVRIDGSDVTPSSMGSYEQATANVSYAALPRSSGALYLSSGVFYSPNTFLADPDLGTNLDDTDPDNDSFPRLADTNPQLVPFVQAGYYFAFTLDPGSHTVQFGDTSVRQDITYNILNPVYGTQWSDRRYGTQGNDYIDGGKGDDRLFGCDGEDLLVGGEGNDLISGGAGADELWGDEGYDTFIFRRGFGADKIYDFSQGDKIDIRGLCWSHGSISTSDLDNGLSATKIQFGGGDVLTLVNINEDQLRIHNGFLTLKQAWHC